MNLRSPGVLGSLGWTAHAAMFKLDNQYGPPVQPRELAQRHAAAWVGAEFGGEWVHAYVWLSPLAMHLKL